MGPSSVRCMELSPPRRPGGESRPAPTGVPVTAELTRLMSRLAALEGLGRDGQALSEAELVDQIAVMERLKSGLAAAQARVTARLDARRRARESAAGVPAAQRGKGLGREVALARRDSVRKGDRHLGFARALVREMPHTLAALTRGEISEWRATLVVQATAVLSAEHRAMVDAELAGALAGLGDKQVAARARAIGYRLDPGSALRRVRGAHGDRRVGLRPAPDTMSYLTGFLPVAQGVACHAALARHADSLRARGDSRSRGQIMADTLVERVTGQATADAGDAEIGLVMTDRTLFGAADTPARLAGYGPIPASLARQIVRGAHRAWLRRLFAHPASGALVAMDSRRRCFDGELRHLLVLRDELCRTPWCGAPVRHADHVRGAARGGATRAANGAGLCAACNYAKERPGWDARTIESPDGRHTIAIITPTGHRYHSRAPDLPGGTGPPVSARVSSPLESRLGHLAHAA